MILIVIVIILIGFTKADKEGFFVIMLIDYGWKPHERM